MTTSPAVPTNPHAARQRGFTLAELLTSVVMVALLVATVAPSLSAARDRSRHVVCLDRLGKIGIASRTYAADDPNGWFIPAHHLQFQQEPGDPTFIGAYEWGGKSGVGRPGSVDGPSEGEDAWTTSKYGTKIGFGPSSRPLNGILYPHGFRDNSVPTLNRNGALLDTQLELPAYRCPSDTHPPRSAHCPDWTANPDRSSYDHFGNSFAANIFMTAHSGSGNPMLSNSPYLRPLTRIPNPVRTIAYEENIGRWAWACRREIDECYWIGPGVNPGPTLAVDGWHGKPWTYNRSFVDTHAEYQRIYNEGTEDEHGYATHYRIERVFEDDNVQGHYKCTIIRGDGWQKDTLPSPLIPTGVGYASGGRPSYEDCAGYDKRATEPFTQGQH